MQTSDWRQRNQWIADLLKRRTGEDVDAWNARIRETDPQNEASLRTWLARLRLDQISPGGRLERAASMGSNTVTLRIGLRSVDDVDDEVESWLRRAYAENN
jgi:hypothetical protein